MTLAQVPTGGINATTLPSYFPAAKNFMNIGSLMNLLVPVLITGAGLIFLALMFIAAYKVLTSAGDPEKILEARNTATYGIVGLVVIMLAFLIVRLVAYVLQVQLPI